MVQRRATRWTLRRFRNTSSVTDMLTDLNGRPLEQRRADIRLNTLFKITCGFFSVETTDLL